MSLPAIAVVAEDLIWASRIVEAVGQAGARPVRISTTAALDELLAGGGPEGEPLAGAVVDLFARRVDAAGAIGRLVGSGVAVIAVAEHDDAAARAAARAAGAERVFSYNRFHREGGSLVRDWIDRRGERR